MVGTRETGMETADTASRTAGQIPRITYVAYPSSLMLRSANAVQTYATVDALQSAAPDCAVILPRFAFRPSAFSALDATHLLRLPFNAGRHLIHSVLWSYLERTWFAFRVLVHLIAATAARCALRPGHRLRGVAGARRTAFSPQRGHLRDARPRSDQSVCEFRPGRALARASH